jgi:hypothetical protein
MQLVKYVINAIMEYAVMPNTFIPRMKIGTKIPDLDVLEDSGTFPKRKPLAADHKSKNYFRYIQIPFIHRSTLTLQPPWLSLESTWVPCVRL